MTNGSATVGLLHPGEMGATVGATVVGGGARVLWASEGRSAATRSRALQIVLDAPNGAASALKIAFAGWNKGSQALLAAIRAFALAEGVDAALLAEWKISMPDTIARSERTFRDNARKAWRFVGEMEEIARSLAGVGLPAGFHEAAREIYERLADYK